MRIALLLRAIALIIVLAVIGSAIYLALQPVAPPAIGEGIQERALRHYDNPDTGLRFSYFDSYTLASSASTTTRTITLADRSTVSKVPPNSERPISITIETYPAPKSLEQWIRTNQASNFKLSPDKHIATSTISGAPALKYRWDGLYQGESIAVIRGEYLFVFSVTYDSPTDPIRTDFRMLLRSVVL